jgi:hypothetical protein
MGRQSIVVNEHKVDDKVEHISYLTHDNGGRPFKVKIYSSRVDVWAYSVFVPMQPEQVYDQKVAGFDDVSKVWLGGNGDDLGHAILLEMADGKFVFIGGDIFELTLSDGERFEKFISYVGNSDVPYPWMVTDRNVYFLIENCYSSIRYHVNPFLDAYRSHYDKKCWHPDPNYQYTRFDKRVICRRLLGLDR